MALGSSSFKAALAISLAVAANGGVAAQVGPPQTAQAASHVEAGDPAARLQRLIGEARCTQDAHCRTLAVGHRACGGPERFVAWSVLDSRADELAEAAAHIGGDATLPGGVASTCEVLADPGARCKRLTTPGAAQGRCVLRASSGAPTGAGSAGTLPQR